MTKVLRVLRKLERYSTSYG